MAGLGRVLRTALVVALALLLPGCSTAPDKAAAAAPLSETSPSAAPANLDAKSSVPAPDWAIGQWWEWETSFGTSVSDFTYCSIVIGKEGKAYTVATEKTEAAKEEATFGMPLLGSIAGGDLAMTGWGDAPWALLSFPLSDGKTWTTTMPNIAWDSIHSRTADLAMSAAFDAAIGKIGGFHITGSTGGATLVQGEYDAAAGWFTGLRFYDTDAGEEGLEIGFRAKSMGLDYTGPYFVHTAKPLLVLEDGSGFTDDPTQGGQPFVQPQPQGTFTMQAGTRLYGQVFVDTVLAARTVALLTPAGEVRQVNDYNADLNGDSVGALVDEPAIPGDWHIFSAGAGGYSQASVHLFELTEGNFTMAAAAGAASAAA